MHHADERGVTKRMKVDRPGAWGLVPGACCALGSGDMTLMTRPLVAHALGMQLACDDGLHDSLACTSHHDPCGPFVLHAALCFVLALTNVLTLPDFDIRIVSW